MQPNAYVTYVSQLAHKAQMHTYTEKPKIHMKNRHTNIYIYYVNMYVAYARLRQI